MKNLIDIVQQNWDLFLILIAIIEVFVRLLPTKNNYSLIDFLRLLMVNLHKAIDKFIPNLRRDV
jgi:hypothetical protein